MTPRNYGRTTFTTVLVSTLLIITGCPPQEPPRILVLQGTWELTPAPTNVSDFLLTFNDNGNITRIQYTLTDPSSTVPVTVTIDDPEFVDADSSVEGNDVAITATWAVVNNLNFDGTLNDAEDQIDGTATYFIQVGNVTVSLPETSARLTRQ